MSGQQGALALAGHSASNDTKLLTLRIRNFAQIREVNLTFGDLTVLVGAQGTGKSLALQWLKAGLDGKHVVKALKEAGQQADRAEGVVDLVFGVGMGSAWRPDSEVSLGGKRVNPQRLGAVRKSGETAFFVPAHRSMLISDGWAAPFQKLSSDTPVVARMFSQTLFDRFSTKGEDALFPKDRLLKRAYREQIDAAIYHGGTIGLEQDAQLAKRLKMRHGDAGLPFMTWTAGQREFTPLLLGLYHLLPARNLRKREDIDWVIIEEPEMGLHPQAITVFLLLVLDLLWRGYRVVLSSHSPHLLTGVWMLQRLRERAARWTLLREAFDTGPGTEMKDVFLSALEKSYRVHYLAFDATGTVRSRDISNLDPDATDDDEADWGGLTGFSSRFTKAVRDAVNESDR